MTPEEIRVIYVNRLNLLVDRDLAEQLVEILRDQAFVGGDLLPTRREFRELADGFVTQQITASGHVSSMSRPCTRQQRYVSLWQEVTE